jgi:5-methylcytosine-specific restriction endonuclease McrA
MLNKYSEEMIQAVWGKGAVISGYDSSKYRKDQCGAWISRSEYGNRNSKFGWEIDHITPDSQDGDDSLSNLRPLQWKNNVAKSDGRLTCPVKANGNSNVEN